MIRKILFGILLLLLPAVSWGQFAEPPDSSTVVGWKFTTFDDVTDTCWLVRQNTSDTLWAHLDDTSAVLWTAISDTCWLVRQNTSDTLWAHLDDSTAILWTAITDTAWMLHDAIHDSLFANTPGYSTNSEIGDTIQDHWTAFTAGGDGTTNADSIKHIPVEDTIGNIGDNFGLIFDQGNSDLEWKEFFLAPVTAPTDNYLFKIDTDPDPDTLYWAEDDTVDTYREAIADTIADHWTVFTVDPGAAIDDSIKNGWQIYQKIDSTDAVIDSAIGAEQATVSGKADSALAFTHQGIKKFHLDSTSENFVFDGAYHITSAETDSQFVSKKYIDDAVAGGGTTNADSIVHIPIEDTTDNIGDLHGLLFDQSADSLLWEEFWATPITDPTDGYVLKIDTDPDPDTFYWAPSVFCKKGSVLTINAAQTTLLSYTLLDGTTYHFEVYIACGQNDETDQASYHLACTVYRAAAGGATIEGLVTTLHIQESNVNLDADFTVSGNDIRVSVTGIVAETWKWGATLVEYAKISF